MFFFRYEASRVNSLFWLLLAASTSASPILISETALKVFTNRRRCPWVLKKSGCEMYRLADIAGNASRTDNFVNPTSEFLRNRDLKRWQGCLKFPCEDY